MLEPFLLDPKEPTLLPLAAEDFPLEEVCCEVLEPVPMPLLPSLPPPLAAEAEGAAEVEVVLLPSPRETESAAETEAEPLLLAAAEADPETFTGKTADKVLLAAEEDFEDLFLLDDL